MRLAFACPEPEFDQLPDGLRFRTDTVFKTKVFDLAHQILGKRYKLARGGIGINNHIGDITNKGVDRKVIAVISPLVPEGK
jgi:hypothetical protein